MLRKPNSLTSYLIKPLRLICTLSFGLLISLPAVAADTTTPLLPGAADAGRVSQMLNVPTLPSTGGGAIYPGFTPQAASAAALRTQFKLNKLEITGSTVYGNAQLADMFQNYLGRTISLADLQQIADVITLKYRKDGYIVSKAIVPAQAIKDGVANIRIIEGYINEVNIAGDPKGARKLLEQYGDQLKKARPLNLATLERYALLANDIPGLSVKTILSAAEQPNNVIAPSDIVPGGVDLTFVAEQHNASGYMAYDNRGTRYLGPKELTLSGNVNSVFRSGDQTGVQVLTTTNSKELRYINVFTQQPIGSNGMQLNLSANYSHTVPGYILQPLGTLGISKGFSIGLNYPVVRSRIQSMFLTGTFDYLNNNTNLTAFNTNLFNDQIRSLRVGANYNLNDRWAGIDQVDGQLSQGIKAFGASNDGSPNLSRPEGQSDYTKVTADASRLQGLGHNFSILAGTEGQYAFTPLLSAEQFGYGGVNYGQAYDPSEITGDHGLAAKAELRYNQQTSYRALRGLQYFGFYDIGKIWNRSTAGGQIAEASGSSTGVGIRASFTSYLASSLEFAKPLTRNVATQGNKSPRIFFSISLAGDTPTSFASSDESPTSTPAPASTMATYTGLTPNKEEAAEAVQPPAPPVTTASTTTTASSSHSFFQRYAYGPFRTKATPASAPDYVGLTPVASHPVAAVDDDQTNLAQTNDNTVTQGYYTLQLRSGRNLADLQRFAQANDLTGKTSYLTVPKEGKNWYILAYGHYASAQTAEGKIPQLASQLSQKPWVRYIKDGTDIA